MEDEITSELPWSNSRTVLNLSGQQCGTFTKMKTPETTKWTTVEGTLMAGQGDIDDSIREGW